MISRDYGMKGAIVRKAFQGFGNDFIPGNILSSEDMAKITPENRFHLVRSGYIELNEDQGETLTGDIQRLKVENDKLKAEAKEAKAEVEKWKKEAEALRSAIHSDEQKGGSVEEVPDRDTMKAKADELGIEYPKNIKTEKLIELINEKEAE